MKGQLEIVVPFRIYEYVYPRQNRRVLLELKKNIHSKEMIIMAQIIKYTKKGESLYRFKVSTP